MFTKSKFRLVALLLALAVISSGCTSRATLVVEPTSTPKPTNTFIPELTATVKPPPEPIVLTDGFDREVHLPEPAQRIVSIAPSSTEILFATGAGSQVVGRDEISDYPPEVVDVPSIGMTYGDLNTEAIIALQPDLVVAAMINSPEHIQTLEDLGLTVFVLPNPMGMDDLYQILETAGKLTGHEAEAAELVGSLRARVEVVAEKLENVDPVKVYFEVDGTDPTAPWTLGSGTFQNVLIQLAGGVNIAADLEGYALFSPEELIVRDPEVMIFSASPWIPTTVESVMERPGWREITAVANGAVYGIDTNWIDRPGPRIVDALEALAMFIHPERFE